MQDAELEELLQFTRQEMRRRNRSDVDALLVESRSRDIQSPREQLIRYLEGLRDEAQLGSERVSREIVSRLRRSVRSSTGNVEGVVVDVNQQDRRVFGTNEIRLTGSPALDDVVVRLNAFIEDLREDGRSEHGIDA